MLEIKELHKYYKLNKSKVHAVKGVNFRVEAGEFFTLLGPSGCGKTTILRCLAGLETPDSGDIIIDGVAVFSGKRGLAVPPNRRSISMVFQSYAIWPHMTVFQNVAFPLDGQHLSAAESRRKVMQTLELVALQDFADRPATLLSGGQQQRVALARAFAKDAKVLLLDEPLSNLDAKLREQMRGELRELQQGLGRTTVYVTHDQEEALGLSSRLAVISEGEIIEEGSPEALYLTPSKPFTAQFVGQADLLPCSVKRSEPEGLLVSTPLGSVRAGVFPKKIPATTSLLIRPEHVEILGPARERLCERNHFNARVVSAMFSGKAVEYLVEVKGCRIKVQAATTVVYRKGAEICLRLPVNRCVVLESE